MAVEPSNRDPRARFPPTRRSAVAAVGSDDPAERARSFDVLVRAYWKPAYAHVRLRWRAPIDDARDLTQAFFARAFEKRWLTGYDPARGLFRTYLRTCLDRFVMESARDERRLKRGGARVAVSLDFDGAEEELARLGAATALAPDACFDAQWGRHMLATAVATLEEECRARRRDTTFAVFRRYVIDAGDARPTYAALARELGISVSDVTNHLSWARREMKRIVLEALSDITATDAERDAEARVLLGTPG